MYIYVKVFYQDVSCYKWQLLGKLLIHLHLHVFVWSSVVWLQLHQFVLLSWSGVTNTFLIIKTDINPDFLCDPCFESRMQTKFQKPNYCVYWFMSVYSSVSCQMSSALSLSLLPCTCPSSLNHLSHSYTSHTFSSSPLICFQYRYQPSTTARDDFSSTALKKV